MSKPFFTGDSRNKQQQKTKDNNNMLILMLYFVLFYMLIFWKVLFSDDLDLLIKTRCSQF